jgi:ankyrin repeat protein
LEPTSPDTINMALRIGASFGFYELAKLELDMGATDHIISSFPENSLHLAATAGRASLVQLLIDYGADVNSIYSSGDTPLFHAIASGHHEVVRLLLEAGASPAATTQTSGAMEELRLEPIISEQRCICGRSKTSFIVGLIILFFSHSPTLSMHAPV